jgi:truncated hemoglobin YjbI
MRVDMKIGLVSEEGIGLLVDHFYAKVRVDPRPYL